MLRIALAEDQAQERARLERYLKRYAQERGLTFAIESYENGAQAVERYRPGTDLLLLDIEMPGLDGMGAARLLRRRDANVAIVFVTNLAQYAIQGYEVEAADFIVKPLDWNAFAFRMDRILSRLERRRRSAAFGLTVREDSGALRRIEVPDLYYVEVDRHRLTYHTSGGAVCARGTMREAEAALLTHGFCRCNQCYLVNLRYVTAVDDEMASVGGDRLRVSRSKKKELIRALSEYVAST